MTRRTAGPVWAAALAVLVASGCTPSGGSTTTVPDGSTVTTTTVVTPPTGDTTTTTPSTTTSTPETTTTTVPLDEVSIRFVEVDNGFDEPVLIVASPDAGPDLVVEQPGRIVRADGSGHAVVLDITDDVRFGGEQGLLGFAAHPEFPDNGLVYVNYTNGNGDTVIEQFTMVGGSVDPATRLTIITIAQPAGNHNGGMIAFGPDGYLWIGMGDGGGSGDQYGNGQNTGSLLAAMLRIEVGTDGGQPYAIPSDNPFSDGVAGLAEIWATGLRNPWRFTFDGDDLWIADVGQSMREEVNVTSASDAGLNYGWSIMEGTVCFRGTECDQTGLVLPLVEYTHADGCSITGGVVYRGEAIPSLRGQYFYSDFCSGIVRSISSDGIGRDWTDMVGPLRSPTGFGTGGDGEMYVVTKQGSLLKVEAVDNG